MRESKYDVATSLSFLFEDRPDLKRGLLSSATLESLESWEKSCPPPEEEEVTE